MTGVSVPDFRAVFRHTPGLYLLLTRELEIAEATETWLHHLQTARQQVLGRNLLVVLADGPDGRATPGPSLLRASLVRVLDLGRPDAMPVSRYDIRLPDGKWAERYWTVLNAPVHDDAGEVAWIVHRVRDVTELVRLRREGAERDELARDQQLLITRLREANEELARRTHSLSESERRLAIALQAGRLGSWEMTLPDRGMVSSDLHKACYGLGPEESFDHDDLRAAVHPDDRDRRQTALARALADGTDYDVEYRAVWRDGSVHWVQIRGQVTVRWPDGTARRMVGVSLDITDQKRLEERLEARVAARTQQLAEANARLTAAIAERDKAERALLQAQRLEAIGQLTGGVAHDFNNLLAAIVGNLELLSAKLTDAPLRRHIDAALAAAWRGGRLTQQLLAYARQQRMVPTSVDINRLVAGMDGLLRHTLGGLVQVETALDPALWPALTDATQLELVLLNLAINARDAMPGGGVLQIVTRNATDAAGPDDLEPAEYVMITVTDTGTGMTAEVLARAFEPFFTTKEVGRGSGLGLAQAYGFARQSGGTMRLKSVLGRGTTVELFLRRAETLPRPDRPAAAQAETALRPAKAFILVDDEPDIRAVTAEFLRNAGHAVEEAANGHQALEILRERRFDLAVVDYGMPGMSGVVLATLARELRPDLHVLFITGNPDALNAIALDGRTQVLTKPYRREELLRAIFRLLPVERRSGPTSRVAETAAFTVT